MDMHVTSLRYRGSHLSIVSAALAVLFTATASSQTSPPPANNPDANIVTTQSTPSQDEAPTPPAHDPKASPTQKLNDTWSTLTTAVKDPKHPQVRIQGLAALGTLGSNPRSLQLISAAMSDPDLDVRTAAILAAGQTKNLNLTTDLRTMLDDKEPQVAFTAAVTLWKMNDPSGEDILVAVVDGERSGNAKLMNGTRHSISKTLHSPSTLARIGTLQGASLLLGPFGFGITAYEYMRKNGGDSARVNAIELLSQEKTGPIRAEFIAALSDKDPAVRAASAKALGSYHEPEVSDSLYPLLDDPKAPVRFTAAAAYINTTATIKVAPRRTKR